MMITSAYRHLRFCLATLGPPAEFHHQPRLDCTLVEHYMSESPRHSREVDTHLLHRYRDDEKLSGSPMSRRLFGCDASCPTRNGYMRRKIHESFQWERGRSSTWCMPHLQAFLPRWHLAIALGEGHDGRRTWLLARRRYLQQHWFGLIWRPCSAL